MRSCLIRLRVVVGLCFLLVGGLALMAAPPAAQGAVSSGAGAETSATVLLKAVVRAPVWYDDRLDIVLRPDEYACRVLHDDEWEERCQTWLGELGSAVRGLTVTPAIEGDWKWTDDNTLGVTPKKGWPSDRAYTVDLRNLALPLGVAITNPVVQVSTLPFAAAVENGQVWIDPAPGGKHAVSFGLRFTAPADKAAVEKQLRLAPVERATSLKLTSPSMVWLDAGTRCLVRADITSLPREATRLRLQLPEQRALVRERNQWRVGNGEAQRDLVVAGTDSLFKPEKLELVPFQNAALQTEYHLVARFSLRVRAEDVLRHLSVAELPQTRDAENIEAFAWNRAQITPEDVAAARPLKVEPVSVPGESGDVLRFRVPVAAGRHVVIIVGKGLGPSKELTLARDHVVTAFSPPVRAQVDFLQPGNVLPLSGERKVDLVSSDLSHIEWNVQRVLPERLGPQQLASLFNTSKAWESTVLDEISDAVSGRINLPESVVHGVPAPVFSSLDLAPLFLQGAQGPMSGLMVVELKGYKGDKVASTARRLVMVTDLGLVLKHDANNGQRVFVGSLSRGGPLAGVRVSIVGANGQPVAEAVTSEDGSARLPSVRGLQREKEPRAVVARLTTGGQTDLAWMPLNSTARQVDYSQFPVGGQVSAAGGINAYVFAQRGVFRPGETLHFGFMLRRGDWQALPPAMPLTAVLRDPSGRVLLRRAFTVAGGLGECSWPLPENAPTGSYSLAVTTPAAGVFAGRYDEDAVDDDGGLELGSGTVRVEEFQPDTLSVQAELVAGGAPIAARGWIEPQAEASARVTLRNLYGLPATERRVKASLNLNPAALFFAGYETYTFSDMLPWKGEGLHRELPESLTGAEGQATFPLGLESYQSGTLQAYLLVEGFEPDGGRSVTTDQRFLVSPLPYMLGYRPAGTAGNLDFLPKGSASGLEFVAVDAQLAAVDPGPLRFEVDERRYVTSLIRDSRGQFRYDETPVDTPIASSTERLGTGDPLYWAVPTAKPGEFMLTVKAADRVLARVPFTVAGDDDLRPAVTAIDELPSTQLRLRLDKQDYAAGDTVRVFVAAPFDGVGLLTLERDSVAAHTWFTAKAGHSVQTLTLPRDFEGRGYINVSLARSLTSPDIFLQPHTFAVAPLSVNVQARNMGLALNAPALAKPGEALPVRLTAAKKGQALVFAVDEGVLQLTRFTTPDPLRHLLLDRALEVSTYQFFDRLMPDHARLAGRFAAFGGGMSALSGRFNNPFKRRNEPPMAWWSGLVDVGPEGLDLAVPVPDYINSRVRIMAVGLTPEAAGHAETETTVRNGLVLTPQFPLLAAPGDTFTAALAVANTTETPVRVTLRSESDPALTVLDLPAEPLDLAPGQERLVTFNLAVADVPGHAETRLYATDAAGNTAWRRASLSVRPPTLPAHMAENGLASASRELSVPRQLHPYHASGSATVSASPLPALRGMLRYFRAYPYGCTEQMLSKALPMVLLYRQPDLDAALRQEDEAKAATYRRETIDAALAVLRSTYDTSEGVAYWPYGGRADLLLTAYAADWLLALREAGLGLPGDLASLFGTLDKLTNQAPSTLDDARDYAYGIWVLTRAGYITTQKLEQLTAMLDKSGVHCDMAFSLMAGSWAALRLHDAAAKALGRYTPLPAGQGLAPLDAVSAQALHVAVLARHFPDQLRNEADKLAGNLLAGLNSRGGYATFAAAQSTRALLALTQASDRAGALDGVELVCAATQPGFAKPEAQPHRGQGLLSLAAPGCARYELRLPAGSPPLYWEVESAGYDRMPPVQGSASGLEVTRTLYSPDGAIIDPAAPEATVAQGDLIRVEIGVTLTSGPEAPVVLANLLPGGFEQIWDNPDNTNTSGDTRVDRREDRLEIHTKASKSPQTFISHIRAVNKGRMAVPAVRAEGLYNRALSGSTGSGIVTVK